MKTEMVGIDASGRWDEVVAEFPDADVYNLAGFHLASSVAGEGAPWLVVARNRGGRAAIPMLVRQIPGWPGRLDASSAYGYPGVLLKGTTSAGQECIRAAIDAMREQWAPVTLVIRQSPFRNEAPVLCSVGRIRPVGRTVAVDLRRPEAEIWSSTRSLHRRRFRQAEQLGPQLIVDEECTGLDRFYRLYEETMDRVGAAPRYHLNSDYLEALESGLDGRLRLFHAALNGRIESSALALDSGRVMHYHLGGWSDLGLRLGLSRWLLEQMRRWAGQAGREWYHLGGGVGAADDTLYWFKRGFSGTDLWFSIAELILDEPRYAEMSDGLERSTRFFPRYRSATT